MQKHRGHHAIFTEDIVHFVVEQLKDVELEKE